MYLLYLDGSGSVKNPNERHFILAGIAVFERQVFHLIKRTDQYIGDLAVAPDDPVEYAFEEVCNRFDLFLRRLHFRDSDTNRGLVVMDKSHYEDVLQGLAAKYREHGTRWGDLRNMAEVPLFVDSAASRLIQLADLLAWAVWRYYEHADTRYFNRIVRRFDAEGGVIHGLFHRTVDAADCYCPACMSRNVRNAVYPRPPRPAT